MAGELYVSEPPPEASYRPPLVVDASFVAAIVFAEAQMEVAADRLRSYTPVAPALLDFEMANIARSKVAQRSLPLDKAVHALVDFLDLPIERLPVDCGALVRLADRYRLTAYDAAYLWLAGAIPAPLATFDRTLAVAARDYLARHGGAEP